MGTVGLEVVIVDYQHLLVEDTLYSTASFLDIPAYSPREHEIRITLDKNLQQESAFK